MGDGGESTLSGTKTKKGAEAAKTDPGVDMATAVGNPWRSRILGAAAQRDLSPSAFIREYGGEISNISRHFRQLAQWGYLEEVERKSGGPRRGGIEHVYRTVRRAHLDTPSSKGLSQLIREEFSDTTLADYLKQIRDSVVAGTFDEDVERHLSWVALELNRECFQELSGWLDDLLARMPELQQKARRQMEESGEEPIATTVGLASFRSAPTPPEESVSVEDGR